MAVPKKRTGHSAQGKRRSNWKAAKPELTTALTHTVCTACGTYKGKVVSKKAEGYVEEAKEEVKEVKKAKKSAKKEEAAPEVEVKAEEKAEVVEEASEETPEA